MTVENVYLLLFCFTLLLAPSSNHYSVYIIPSVNIRIHSFKTRIPNLSNVIQLCK